MRSCRSICTRTRCSAAPAWSRRAPISRSSAAPSSPASSRRAQVAAALRSLAFALLGLVAGRQVPPAPPAAERMPVQLAHYPRLGRAGQRDHAHPAAVPRDPRDQLLLDHRRGAVHHVPAAGEERAWRRRAGRQPVHRHLLDRHRDRLGAINRLLKGEVSARYAPGSVLAMGVFVLLLLLRRADVGRARRPS